MGRDTETAPLLEQNENHGLAQHPFNYAKRQAKDVPWVFLYIAVLLLNLLCSGYAFLHRQEASLFVHMLEHLEAPLRVVLSLPRRNRRFFELTSQDHLNDPQSCPVTEHGRSLLALSEVSLPCHGSSP